ncbi:MAG: hypothetical protein ACQCXQ_00200 [Verrucomicrobiales bacterium]|nr:hypothetical protein [Verrucomicrobiota bacterium JB025]
MIGNDDGRVRQVVSGILILVVLTLVVVGVLLGGRLIPGLLGEWIGTMVGVVTTPVFLEISFVILGFTIVLVINSVRRKREGEELVYLEQVDGVELPEHAKWAVYRDEPLAGEEPELIELAEGAMELGDLTEVADYLARMPESELEGVRALELRVKLAEASGMPELAERLAAELARRRELRH